MSRDGPRLPDWAEDLDPSVKVAVAQAQLRRLQAGKSAAELVSPLTRLFELVGDPDLEPLQVASVARFAEALLPYVARRLADVLPTQMPTLGPFTTMADLTDTQSKVMLMMSSGQLSAHTGKTYIEALALMARTFELAGGAGNGTLRVMGGLPDLPVAEDEAASMGMSAGGVVSLQERKRDAG